MESVKNKVLRRITQCNGAQDRPAEGRMITLQCAQVERVSVGAVLSRAVHHIGGIGSHLGAAASRSRARARRTAYGRLAHEGL